MKDCCDAGKEATKELKAKIKCSREKVSGRNTLRNDEDQRENVTHT